MSSNKIITSVHGRRLGLQLVSSSVMGQSTGFGSAPAGRVGDFLAGPDAFLEPVSTVASSAVSIPNFGVTILTTGTAASSTSSLYLLDKPFAGVRKTLVFNSSGTATNAIYVYTSTDASICFSGSSIGSTLCCIGSSDGIRATVDLVGLNSTQWAITHFVSTTVFKLSTLSS